MNNEYVHRVAKQSGSNFYVSFFSLPKPQREAMTAVYAFCREVDDAVDLPTGQAGHPQGDPEQAIARWREEINRTYDGKPTLPLTRSLLQAIETFHLSKEYFDGILDGVAMDLRVKRYQTFEDLLAYCYHVAGEVGLLCMEIFGYRSERLKKYAIKLGTAFQLTNILRDIGSDMRNGRLYIPQEDLQRFGVTEEQLARWSDLTPSSRLPADDHGRRLKWAGSPGWPNFQNLMAFEARRARGYYHEASVLPTAAERPALRAAEIMRAVYEHILGQIEPHPHRVFSAQRIRVPTPTKLYLAAKTWWENR